MRLYGLSTDGKQLTLALLKDGNIFGETDSFATAGSCYAETVTDTLVCTMTTSDLIRFMEHRLGWRSDDRDFSRELRNARELAASLALCRVTSVSPTRPCFNTRTHCIRRGCKFLGVFLWPTLDTR